MIGRNRSCGAYDVLDKSCVGPNELMNAANWWYVIPIKIYRNSAPKGLQKEYVAGDTRVCTGMGSR